MSLCAGYSDGGSVETVSPSRCMCRDLQHDDYKRGGSNGDKDSFKCCSVDTERAVCDLEMAGIWRKTFRIRSSVVT